MKAVVHRRLGDPQRVLSVEVVRDALARGPRRGEVVVQVRAASVNAADWLQIVGRPRAFAPGMALAAAFGVVRGMDVAGEVVAVGEGAGGEDGFRVGDRVFGYAAGGCWAERVAVPRANLALLPEGVGFAAGGAAAVAGITALSAVREAGGGRAGERVLVNGATGGVGTCAVQVAKALGAEVTAVCRAAKRDTALACGADRVLAYDEEDVVAASLGAYDCVVDVALSRTLDACRAMLTPTGRYVSVGAGIAASPWFGPLGRIARMAAVSSTSRLGRWRSRWSWRRGRGRRPRDPPETAQTLVAILSEETPQALADVADMLARGTLRPVVERVCGLDGAAEAVAYAASGHATGKLVIDPSRPPEGL